MQHLLSNNPIDNDATERGCISQQVPHKPRRKCIRFTCAYISVAYFTYSTLVSQCCDDRCVHSRWTYTLLNQVASNYFKSYRLARRIVTTQTGIDAARPARQLDNSQFHAVWTTQICAHLTSAICVPANDVCVFLCLFVCQFNV